MSQLLAECRWSEDANYMSEIANKTLPVVARVSHGNYACLGQNSFPNRGLVSHVLIVSSGIHTSVAAQCVKIKPGRQRVTPYGPTLLIPSSYPGHFEILNEEGRTVPNILTSEALSKTLPPACLVREPFKSCLAEIKEGSDDKVYRIGSKTRTLLPGELVTIIGLVSVPSGKAKVAKYLRCVDQDMNIIFLPCVSKGKFSPLAGEESIGGVHSTRGILKKRLPLMVRLVEGRPPQSNRSFKFFPELRLYTTLQEPLVFALPISPSWKDSLVPLPLCAPIKFQIAKNMDELEAGSKPYAALLHKAKSLLEQIKDRIQVYDINLLKEMRFDGRQWKAYAPPIPLPSTQEVTVIDKLDHPNNNAVNEEDYDDIDELYDYVRGLKPTPHEVSGTKTTLVTITSSGQNVVAHVKRDRVRRCSQGLESCRQPCANVPKHARHSLPEDMLKGALSPKPPSPPPIETIPSRKFLPGTCSSPQPELSISVLNSRNKEQVTQGTQIQIQIRSNGNNDTPNSTARVINNITTRGNKALDSVGGSVSTTPTNTSGSAQSSNSSSSSKGKPRTGLYIKHGSRGDVLTSTSDSLNGGYNPMSRLHLLGRSPVFDCRYKSMTDLNVPSDRLHSSSGSRGSLTSLSPIGPPPLNFLSRPKSLSNLAKLEEILLPKPKPISCSGVKKRLADVVMPHHNHNHIHVPIKSASQRSGRHYRKSSVQHSSIFL